MGVLEHALDGKRCPTRTGISAIIGPHSSGVAQLPDRSILVVSVYVEPQDVEAMRISIYELCQVINGIRRKFSTRVDTVLTGDLTGMIGGVDISRERQGEVDLIIDFMSEYALRSLPPRGTKTWQRGSHESTIHLELAQGELATSVVKFTIRSTEHGSDHRAIEIVLDVATPERVVEARLLFKNALWTDIRARIAASLHRTLSGGTVQQQTDMLMAAVL